MEHARGSDHCEAAVLELNKLAAREGLHGENILSEKCKP